MNPPAGYEHPEVGERISKEFVVLDVENGGFWREPIKDVLGMIIERYDNLKDWARPKNKHWNSFYNVKRPDGFRFLEEGEVIKKSDYYIGGAGFRALSSVSMVIGTKNHWSYSPILRPINKTTKPKKKTALQLADEKVAALTRELEDLKVKIRAGVGDLLRGIDN